MLVRLHFQVNPLQVCGIDAEAVVAVEPAPAAAGGGTDVSLKTGLQYIVHESVDDVIAAVNLALAGSHNAALKGGEE